METSIQIKPPRRRIPKWLRFDLPTSGAYLRTRSLLNDLALHTVCESAKCPNQWECWSSGTATFMIGGDRCTRACGFCAVDTSKPLPLELDEPERVAEAAKRLGLNHVVITGVARDDLKDGGALHFRRSIEAVRRAIPGAVVEVLVPDFNGNRQSIHLVAEVLPEVFNHNLETVRRLTPTVRHRATYDRSLEVLRYVAEKFLDRIQVKSGMMLGLGETRDEVIKAMGDLREAGCGILTLGQYLQPGLQHLPIVEYIHPDRFDELGDLARAMGFAHVFSGPMVRSSYHAADLKLNKALKGGA